MSDIEYEFVSGTPEQVETFLDLQRMIVKLYNKWPGDTAIAVVAASVGCVVALIETQYKLHLEECSYCRDNLKGEVFNLSEVARSNFEHYYNMEVEQALVDQQAADELVKKFFGKKGH
jgi:hypothetical protein